MCHVDGTCPVSYTHLDVYKRQVVIHIFDEENRLFYDLERIWRDGKVVEKEEIM